MRHIGLPVATSHTGGCSDRCGAATRTHYSKLYTTPGSPASGFPTGHAATCALCTAGAKGPASNAQTIGDYSSRRVKTGHAATRAQTAASAGVYAASTIHAATHHAPYSGIHPARAANSANERFAQFANATDAAPAHQGPAWQPASRQYQRPLGQAHLQQW